MDGRSLWLGRGQPESQTWRSGRVWVQPAERLLSAQMSFLLLPPPLLLLLAALVAPATAVTTYRPDWNRLRGLARGRVEVSAPFPILSTTVPKPRSPSSLAYSPLWPWEYQNSRVPRFPSCMMPESSLLFPSRGMYSMLCGNKRHCPCGLAL